MQNRVDGPVSMRHHRRSPSPTLSIMRLQDQVILITGSTTGIGEHMARRFVKEGAKVILHGRDAARGEALRKELGEANAAFCQGNLADAEYPAKLAADAIAAFGKVDALVNNAALTTRAKIAETDAAAFDRIIAVNARAPMLLIRALLPELKKNQGVVLWRWCIVFALLFLALEVLFLRLWKV